METVPRIGRSTIAGAAVVAAALLAAVVLARLAGGPAGDVLDGLAAANPLPLWLAAASFATGVASMGLAWRAGLRACGAELGSSRSVACYAAGSLVNAVSPGGVGTAVRVGLYSRALASEGRVWSTAGVGATVGVARAFALALLVVAAALVSGFPLWPVALLGAVVAAAVGVAVGARGRAPRMVAAHLLDPFRALAATPRAALTVAGWVGLATAARVGAAGCVLAALGVHSPLVAALAIVPALALAGLVQLTPGNVGVASGAIALVVHAHGADVSAAAAAGIAFHALETVVSVLAGGAALAYLSRPTVPAWALRLAGAAGTAAVAGAVGASILVW